MNGSSRDKVIVMTVDGSWSQTKADNENVASSSSSSPLTCSVRLEKVSKDEIPTDVHHVVTGGLFKGVIINNVATGGLPPIRKPNIKMEFFVQLANVQDTNAKPRREARQLLFWFSKKVYLEEQKSQATQYFRLLIEPETFPTDYAGYIKKAMLLLWHFRYITRVQLHLQLEPEPEEKPLIIEEEEEEMIENFITVLTPAVYDYQYLPEIAVNRKPFVTFRVRAGADAHVALSMAYGDTERKTYEVVLGAAGNTKSVIRYGGRGPTVMQADTPKILDPEDSKSFWISWESGVMQVGTGSLAGTDRFMRWAIPKEKQHSINCMSVSTGPGSDGQWEFIEYIKPASEKTETTAIKRAKVRRAVIWHAKKIRILQLLDDAFPASLNTTELMRRSLVHMSDMQKAVNFLKELQSKGLVLELSRGVWLRAPLTSSTQTKEIQIVTEFPSLPVRETPTVAIVTTQMCEKIAVDAMLESKTTVIRHNPDSPINGDMITHSYTLGRVGEFRVVSMKLPLLFSDAEATSLHGDIVTQMIGNFERLQHVIVVGTGGAVPNFRDYERHVKMGDIAVSMPQKPGGPIYIHCQEMSADDDDGNRCYCTRVWDARSDSGTDSAARKLVEFYCGATGNSSTALSSTRRGGGAGSATDVDKRPWEWLVDDIGHRLMEAIGDSVYSNGSTNYRRPPVKTDRLYAVMEPGTEPVLVKHPTPDPGREHLLRPGMPNVRCGTIASGRQVASNVVWRLEVSDQIVAYDRGLHDVIDSLENCSQLNSYIVVLGMSDYADGCKGRTWQPYAGLCAASFVKTLITMIPTQTRRGSYYR